MAKESFDYYKSRIKAGDDPVIVIQKCREDYELAPDFSAEPFKFTGTSIPFNIEREHVICLIEEKKYKEATEFLENMRKTYRHPEFLNFIEIFEYHLHATKYSEINIRSAIEEAKKEFNQHTITIVTVIVGVIALLATANQQFTVTNFNDGLKTFWSITGAIILIIIFAFGLNNRK